MHHLSSTSGGGETFAVLSRMGIGDGEPVRSQGDSGWGLPVPEGSPERDALMVEIRAMVTKGAVLPLPRDPGLGFLLQPFPGDVGDRGVPACNQSQASQPFSPQPSFQNGDLSSHHQGGVSRRLVSVDRPDRHVFFMCPSTWSTGVFYVLRCLPRRPISFRLCPSASVLPLGSSR